MSLDKAVYVLVIALVGLSSLIVVALIVSPTFQTTAPTVIAAVLGPLTTALSILGGILASRGVTAAAEQEITDVKAQRNGGQA